MKINQISLAVALSTLPITSVFAAALERSNQSISAFLEPGNYIEAGFNVTDTNIKGKTTNEVVGAFSAPTGTNYTKSINMDYENVGDTYFTPKINAKIQATEKISIGLMYDEPYKIETNLKQKANLQGVSGYLSEIPIGQNTIDLLGSQSHTSIDISTKSLSLLIGYQPTTNWNIYAGIVNQQLDGNIFLRGLHTGITATPGLIQAYNANFSDKDALGWLTGLAYTNDALNLKTSFTYRSEIKHKFTSNEADRLNLPNVVTYPSSVSILAEANKAMGAQSTFKTPQSASIELSKKISDKITPSLAIRWIDWSNAGLHLPFYEARSKINNLGSSGSTTTPPENEYRRSKNSGYDILRYNKDQWSVDLGLDHKLTDKWKVSGSLGWDSGVGYVSHYTPESGSISAGVGVQYSPASNYFVQTGFKYYWLKDVKGQHSKQVSDNADRNDTLFENNYALSYDFKIGYRF